VHTLEEKQPSKSQCRAEFGAVHTALQQHWPSPSAPARDPKQHLRATDRGAAEPNFPVLPTLALSATSFTRLTLRSGRYWPAVHAYVCVCVCACVCMCARVCECVCVEDCLPKKQLTLACRCSPSQLLPCPLHSFPISPRPPPCMQAAHLALAGQPVWGYAKVPPFLSRSLHVRHVCLLQAAHQALACHPPFNLITCCWAWGRPGTLA